jgi:putative transposase
MSDNRGAVAAPFGFKGAGFDLVVGVEEAKRNALRRFYGSGDVHFVTFSCYRRRPYLGTVRARNRFVKILDEVRSRHGFALLGYVLMPEHVHLLMGEPEQGNPSKVLQVVKQKVSQSLREKNISSQLELAFASGSVAAPAFWQRRFYDFNVWSEKKLKEKLHYMHRNPVDRKLVQHPQDWPWSSWSFYANGEQGLIRIDELTPRARVMQKPHPSGLRVRLFLYGHSF